MNEILVHVPVKHNGKWYKAGDTITGLSVEEFNQLKEKGVDVPVDNQKNSWNEFDTQAVSLPPGKADMAGARAKNGFVRH